MSLEVFVHPRVVQALDDNVAWWSMHHSAEEAERWYDGIVGAILNLEDDPHRWPIAAENWRFPYEGRDLHFGLGRRPTHRVFYTIRPDSVYVFLVKHVSQSDATPDDLD
jgi:hypothetical protein